MKKYIGFIFRFLLLVMFSSGASASLVTLDNLNITANVGETFTVDVIVDFTDEATLGGGVDIFYDQSILAFQSFSFASGNIGADPGFNRDPDELTNELDGLAFGNFNGIGVAGILGTLTFTAISEGNFDLFLAMTDNNDVGPFVSGVTFSVMTPPPNFGTSNVVVSAVPVPAAAWFFGSALFGLFVVRRRS